MKIKDLGKVKELIIAREELLQDLKHLDMETSFKINGYKCCSLYNKRIKEVLKFEIQNCIKEVETKLEGL